MSSHDLHDRLLAIVAATPDQPSIAVNVPIDAIPPGFSLPRWTVTESVPFGQALALSLAERPAVRKVSLLFPGVRIPIDFEMTPQKFN